MKLQFEEEDRTELEAHFRERVQAYIELGETPEQAEVSAREKFGAVETTLSELKRQRMRRYFVGKPLGILGISLFWGLLYAALFSALFASLNLIGPINAGETMLWMAWVIGSVGFISGGIFGLLLSLNESGKAILDISLRRVALWGILSGAAFPVLTGRANQIFWTCPFGAIVALALFVIARRAERRKSLRRGLFSAGIRALVRFAVYPLRNPVRRGN